ncbi:MAG: hypothetical protein K0S33_4236 [Bacteroidetes bacterium]|jgi:YVTN family beta-propeller protein|nr:hypothetical protein [Bacteroidota bacterium]
MLRKGLIGSVLIFFCILIACTKDSDKIDTKDYPVEIGKIFRGRCATSGCHNEASYKAAGGLNLTSWASLFQGSNTGSSIIPFRSDFSSLCYFINTYPDMGIINLPTMPVGLDPLDRGEVQKIKDWINAGAPNLSGGIPFGDDPNRSKFYVAHTACKVVCVFDAATRLQMRYITVLNPGETFMPHMTRVSPDGKYWYVCFNNNGKFLRRYNTSDDSFAGEVNIGSGEWNSFAITPDSKKAFVIDWTASGKVAQVDLEHMELDTVLVYPNMPHGSAVSPNGQYMYFTATTGNYLYKQNIASGEIDDLISLSNSESPGPSNVYNPHEILFSPDGSKYYVTCQSEHTVRVFNAATDMWIATIPISGSTLEMSLAPSKNLLFVTSWDASQFANTVGAVAVINTTTNTVQTYVNVGTQPHGIAVDEQRGVVYVANRNIDVTGPLPHHTSVCGGRNGNVVFIDLNTLQLTGKRIEVSVDPYSIGLKE